MGSNAVGDAAETKLTRATVYYGAGYAVAYRLLKRGRSTHLVEEFVADWDNPLMGKTRLGSFPVEIGLQIARERFGRARDFTEAYGHVLLQLRGPVTA